MNLVVSAAGTGSGKTLIAQALCAALRRSGRRVQPYKIGPDYIDARFSARVAGRPAYNVDLWLDGAEGVRAHVAATRGDADVALFEGMMGLYDGDDDGATSTARVATLLGARVAIVLDGWTASQTLAAVAVGLRAFDPELSVAGVVINRTGGDAHERAVRTACASHGIRVIGSVPFDPAFAAAERRLGLDPAAVEGRLEAVERLAERIAAQWDLDALAPRGATGPARTPAEAREPRVRIAYAHDDAFWFTYAETLEALRAAGAEPVPFSPLADTALPPNSAGLWIGGGYPEDHAAALTANATMRSALRAALVQGLPAYAECGGMMYLAQALETAGGTFEMVGALPGTTSTRAPRLHIGYRTVRTCAETPFDPGGAEVRGYEFHYARGAVDAATPAYERSDGTREGVATPDVLASFMHRHFLVGSPAIRRFVDRCAARAFRS